MTMGRTTVSDRRRERAARAVRPVEADDTSAGERRALMSKQLMAADALTAADRERIRALDAAGRWALRVPPDPPGSP